MEEAAITGVALFVASGFLATYYIRQIRFAQSRRDSSEVCNQACMNIGENGQHSNVERRGVQCHSTSNSTYDQLIGNTPLIRLHQLSALCGCEILAKVESRNPAGTGKDRAVQYMLQEARKHPNYRPGVPIVEGSSGSTGIALALQCRALNLPVHIVLPDDQAAEKRLLLEKLGAHVTIVRCSSIANRDHYVHTAKRLAEQLGGVFINQFENLSNYKAHYEVTGPELWSQLLQLQQQDAAPHGSARRVNSMPLDAFVMSAGTGGTIAGVSRFLKEQCDHINSECSSSMSSSPARVEVVLADPAGSSLLQKVKFGVCYTAQQSERTLRKHRYDSIVEGVGLDRVTQNFEQALIDEGFLIEDQEMLNMAHWLLLNEGLFVGSSSAMNIAAAVKTAVKLRSSRKRSSDDNSSSSSDSIITTAPVVVTVICDDGYRHLSRFWNADYVQQYNLQWPDTTAHKTNSTEREIEKNSDALIYSLLHSQN